MSYTYSIGALCLCVFGHIGVTLGAEHRSSANVTVPKYIFAKLEVPDNELLLLHGSRFEKWSSKYGRQEDLHHSKPCACEEGVCACCSGLLLGLFGQKACVKVRYNPSDFAFDVSMTFNGNVMYENTISGSDPPPACVSPPRLSNLKVCAKFSRVFFPGRNFHFCTSMIGQWGSTPLFDISFDCLRMGAQGIVMVKPEDGGGIPVAIPGGGVDAVVDSGGDDIEDYDENLVRSLFINYHSCP